VLAAITLVAHSSATQLDEADGPDTFWLTRLSPMRCSHTALSLLLALAAFAAPGGLGARAEDGWKPFAEKDAARAKQKATVDARPVLPPMDGTLGQPGGQPVGQPGGAAETAANGVPAPGNGGLAPLSGASSKVEREELAPVGGSAAPGNVSAAGNPPSSAAALPMELWRGLDLGKIEQLFAKLDIPPRSSTLHGLWRRLLLTDVNPPETTAAQFNALRAEGLHRSGLVRDQAELLAKIAGGNDDPVLTVMRARADIVAGRRDTGCAAASVASANKTVLPKRLRGDLIVMTGYCAAADGNASAAGLAAELAREEGVDAAGSLVLLDAIAAGAASKGKVALPKKLDAIDIRLMQLLGPDAINAAALERADAAGLAALATDPASDPKIRLTAAEGAARLNAIDPEQLGETYRAMIFTPAEVGDAINAKSDPVLRRALLFKAAEIERTQLKKVRVIRALLDDARRIGLYSPMLRALAPSIEQLARVSEIGWFAETAIEISLAAGRYDNARAWVAFASGVDRPGGPAVQPAASLQHWSALIDLADPQIKTARGESLASVEDVALKGRFNADALHRLATVLDALDTNVPVPLWDAANKTPQPAGGHLPETGVLPELLDASKKKEFGRTVLLSLKAIGPNAADGAHIIALGDTIRALRRAGLDVDARRLGFEALFAAWPRGQTN
jgi:hypothetical protein